MQLSSLEMANLCKKLVDEKYKDNHKNRLEHIYGVAEMAEYLGKKYNVDPNICKACAYMHDYSKYDDFNELKSLLSIEDQKECEKYPFLYHAYLSAIFFKKYVSDDIDMYNAIRYHVFGRPNMSKLEEIIMISDFTEKNRKYDACIKCRNILLNDDSMDRAIYESLLSTINHNIEEGKDAHPLQIEVLKQYEERIKQ